MSRFIRHSKITHFFLIQAVYQFSSFSSIFTVTVAESKPQKLKELIWMPLLCTCALTLSYAAIQIKSISAFFCFFFILCVCHNKAYWNALQNTHQCDLVESLLSHSCLNIQYNFGVFAETSPDVIFIANSWLWDEGYMLSWIYSRTRNLYPDTSSHWTHVVKPDVNSHV